MTRSVVTSTSSGGGGGTTATPPNNNWASGTFGTGLIRVYGSALSTYTFTVPTGITAIRVRLWGAGGGGSGISTGAGGGGGGFAIGEFSVTPGTNHTVTVGAGGQTSTSGGASSFGTLISATGGESANNSSLHAGGTGSGGYINHSGGSAQNSYCGGGGSASLFGHGADGSYASNTNDLTNRKRSGGAGGGMGSNSTSYDWTNHMTGWGPWGIHSYYSSGDTNAANELQRNVSQMRIDSIDMLGTGNGGFGYRAIGSAGINGGGGASSGDGGWPGGGGGMYAGGQTGGYGADGCVIVEY